ncbi:hypothetical protein X760_32675 [Mesorhizobium sp. LSHC422A00]|nr:hypothetical protein X762_31460 [Mesorhizobium sp. LSHC426A00]ESX45209.1 hypothetical protein X761_32625 [Mesorhizobium sp. LSHC424B00]ESX48705.1 hypothetical protein X760_32675 [Mesorhizobium sp. LSHC422A00]ESX63885.1 hypothetical protein X758_32795 [Mesorhizobium sp. LSHC416B00]
MLQFERLLADQAFQGDLLLWLSICIESYV